MRLRNALGLTEECRFDSWFKPLVEQEFTARGARCIRRLMQRVFWGIASPACRCQVPVEKVLRDLPRNEKQFPLENVLFVRVRGWPDPIAGRSLRPSRPPLTRC